MTGVVEVADQGQGNIQEMEERQETVEKDNTQHKSPVKSKKRFGSFSSFKKKKERKLASLSETEDGRKGEISIETQTLKLDSSSTAASILASDENRKSDGSDPRCNDQVRTEKPEIDMSLGEERGSLSQGKSGKNHHTEVEAKEEKTENVPETLTPTTDSPSQAADSPHVDTNDQASSSSAQCKGQVKSLKRNNMFSSFRKIGKQTKSLRIKQGKFFGGEMDEKGDLESPGLNTSDSATKDRRKGLSRTLSDPTEFLRVKRNLQDEHSKLLTLFEEYPPLEIPDTPLSVMQINCEIEKKHLEEAHVNLLSMRQELKRELQENSTEDLPKEMAMKEKDLNLLYRALRDKMMNVVRNSNNEQPCDTDLLVKVAQIIQEEEKREKDPGSGEWSWRDSWKEAVRDGVKAKIKSVALDTKEQNRSWLAVHLGQLGKAVVEDLEDVKNNLKKCYPPSFDVFNTYVDSYHQAIAQHLKEIHQKELETKDSYVLLKWILNDYKSENMMGSPTLQPDMRKDDLTLPLEDSFLHQIKETYCDQIKGNLKINLENIIKLQEECWTEKKEPDIEDGLYHSEIHIDIWTVVMGYITCSRDFDIHLQEKVAHVCMEELMHFPEWFETRFSEWSKANMASSLGAQYQVAYINSFTVLKGHIEESKKISPNQVTNLEKKIETVVQSLGQMLMDQFKTDLEPYFRRMMTRKWLSTDADFQKILGRVQEISKHCWRMKPPYVKTFVAKVHYHVVREYISQLMKNNYSCKNRKHERAAEKMSLEWGNLQKIFEDTGSTAVWLYPVGKHLSDIIGQSNKKNIKNSLEPLVRDYPDISQQHLSAVLYFRGVTRGRERKLILRKLVELKKTMGDGGFKDQALFSDIHTGGNIPVGCRDSLALLCKSSSLPER
ncbi:exocyst complex component 3-like protein 4 [Brienomyrus brachyistius]|uniref:exocyst complex component 3-like protein 4 n=1 Tax=Brienomyrus brachyistius TaxID=42636 RepID=UPI0020B1894E|nr:exocyst complex component 3-like protein 4 [Brienomyrus brachyistius]